MCSKDKIMKINLKIAFAPLLILILVLSSCSNEVDNLTEIIEDAWDNIEDEIEESAEEALEDYADNPEKLYKGDCETDYISFGSVFTLTIPIDRTSRAAIGFIFGSDAADIVSIMDDASRNSRSKSDIKRMIEKHFNSSWAGMMTALIILDGEFDYDFENDDWFNASYEFESKELYKILNEKDYFSGVYGDRLPSENGPSERKSTNGIESSGHQNIQGYAIDLKGNRYPFRIEFDSAGGEISNACYYNPAYSTTVKFTSAAIVGDKFVFRGKNGKEDLVLSFSTGSPYEGTLRQGNTTLDVKMTP